MKKTILIFAFLMAIPLSAIAQPMTPVMAPPAMTAEVAPMTAPSLTAPVMAAMPVSMAPAMAAAMESAPKADKLAEKPSDEKKKGTDPWWKVLLGFLATAGLATASALLPVLVAKLVQWVSVKLKTEKIQGLDKQINKWVDMGIEYAEQKATTLSDDPDPNGKKLKFATDFVMKAAESFKLPKKLADLVEDRIEARLKKVKNGKVSENKKPA